MWSFSYNFLEWTTIFHYVVDDYSRYGYLYLIHEKSQSLDVFKTFKAEVELQLGKKIKAIKSDRGGEYYDRYAGSGEQRPRPFALFLRLSQESYIDKVLDRFSMNDSKPGDTPIAKGDKFSLK